MHILTDAIDEFRPDVIYVNNIVGIGGLGLIAALQFLNLAWVWHLGDNVPAELCSDQDGLVPGLADSFRNSIHGTFAVVSGRVKKNSEQGRLGLNGRVELIPYWITGQRPTSRNRYYQPCETLRIMAAGRVDRQKGVDILIGAAALLRRSGFERFSIDVYGKLADPTIPELIRSLGMDKFVRLAGQMPHRELLERYEQYDLFLFPTRPSEPFGIVPLEAMARGCVPIISADCGVAEWLVDSVHCLKSARTSEAFADVIQRVASGIIPLEAIARRGAEASWRDFHLDTIIPKIERMLVEACVERSSDSASRPPGTAGEAYRLARMAEHLSQMLIHDSMK